MKKLLFACFVLLAFLLSACGTSKPIAEGKTEGKVSMADVYKQKVLQASQTPDCLTARIKMEVQNGGKNISANGNLRMKRNEVVQLSLQVLGFEVARLEFMPTEVLIVNRMEKEYVRAAYADVDFLRKAGLDFYSLQALFRNELFLPGEHNVQAALGRFAVQQAGAESILQLTDAPTLNYAFTTETATARISQLAVQGKKAVAQPPFVWRYEDFVTTGNQSFPSRMECQVSGAGKTAGFTLRLSRLSNDSDWETTTRLSSKYKQRSANDLLNKILAL